MTIKTKGKTKRATIYKYIIEVVDVGEVLHAKTIMDRLIQTYGCSRRGLPKNPRVIGQVLIAHDNFSMIENATGHHRWRRTK